MNEFINTFGDITLDRIIIVLIAVGFLIDRAKKIYKSITNYHDKETEKQEILRQFEEYKAKIDLLMGSNLALLHIHLFNECERLITQDFVTITELETLKALYEGYHSLGGNGMGTKLFNDCLALPIKER